MKKSRTFFTNMPQDEKYSISTPSSQGGPSSTGRLERTRRVSTTQRDIKTRQAKKNILTKNPPTESKVDTSDITTSSFGTLTKIKSAPITTNFPGYFDPNATVVVPASHNLYEVSTDESDFRMSMPIYHAETYPSAMSLLTPRRTCDPVIGSDGNQAKKDKKGMCLLPKTMVDSSSSGGEGKGGKSKIPVPLRKKAGGGRKVGFKKFTQRIRLADNVDTPTESEEDIICQEIDLENPMKLDFQGLDYTDTYGADEQALQNDKEYLNIKRKMTREQLKKDIDGMLLQRGNAKKISLPKLYRTHLEFAEKKDDVSFLDYVSETEEEPESVRQAYLYRTVEKPINIATRKSEEKRRWDRYRKLVVAKEQRNFEQKRLRIKQEKEDAINFLINLGETDMKNEIMSDDNKEELIDILMAKKSMKADSKKIYPNTLKEAKYHRQNMKQSKKIIRDKDIIKREFYETIGRHVQTKAADIKFSDETIDKALATPSERSSDDEDGIAVGPEDTDKYLLRGFHFKLGTELRGIRNKKEQLDGRRTEKLCITRTGWFNQLERNAKPIPFKAFIIPNFIKNQLPDDPKLSLFPPKALKAHYDISPVYEYITGIDKIKKRIASRTVKIKKPRTIKVKRFNLTGYLFGVNKDAMLDQQDVRGQQALTFVDINEHLRNERNQKYLEKKRKRRQRQLYLGIPVKETPLKSNIDTCLKSESGSSDWVPELEKDGLRRDFDKDQISIRDKPKDYDVTNMPAPKFRETTLKRHPRKPRKKPEVPVTEKEMPLLDHIPDDEIIPYNLYKGRKACYEVHHHDHLNVNQHKRVDVKYRRRIPEYPPEKADFGKPPRKIEIFERAQPLGKDYDSDIDLTRPLPDYSEYVKKVKNKQSKVKLQQQLKAAQAAKENIPVQETVETDVAQEPKEFITFEGQEDFVKFIKDMAIKVKRQVMKIEEAEQTYAVDRDEYIKVLKEELSSINSCLSTLDSSVCTNFTDDSGSLMMIQDKKLPLDYIRKSLVPFEEIDRVRVKAEYSPPSKSANPYTDQMYPKNKMEVVHLTKIEKDKFHTKFTRSRDDVPSRLVIPKVNISEQLMGPEGGFKAPAKFAADLDEHYMADLKEPRPALKQFRRTTTMHILNEALRKKFESYIIQGKLIEMQITHKKEEKYFHEVYELQELCDGLFEKWQKTFYDSSMEKVGSVRHYYEKSDKLKRIYNEFTKKITFINMQIVYMEDHWIRLTMLQNFHYLIMKNNWREEHDWIHKKEDGTLENYRESIEKRSVVNIRVRDRDDAWAIKEYYENTFLKNKHPIVIVFPDPGSFMRGYQRLQSRTFVCLLELHYTMWVLANLQREYNEFKKWSTEFVESRTKLVKGKSKKRYFMEDRAVKLQQKTKELMGEPLETSIADLNLRTISAITDVVFQRVVPAGIRANMKEDSDVLDKVSRIFDVLVNILEVFEGIPSDMRKRLEDRYRKILAYRKRLSANAVGIAKRINLTMEQIKHNLAPPAKFKKVPKKYRRFKLKKKERKVVVVKKPMSQKNRNYLRAFYEGDVDMEKKIPEGVDGLEGVGPSYEDASIPFYFDHFLRLNGYEPNYNFVTDVERRDGDEENYMKYKWLLPLVYEKYDKYQRTEQKVMEMNIKRTPHYYTEVHL